MVYDLSTPRSVYINNSYFSQNKATYGGVIGLLGNLQIDSSVMIGNNATFGPFLAASSSGQLRGQGNLLYNETIYAVPRAVLSLYGQFSKADLSCGADQLIMMNASFYCEVVLPTTSNIVLNQTNGTSAIFVNDKSLLSTSAIIGIAVGGSALILLIVVATVLLFRKKRSSFEMSNIVLNFADAKNVTIKYSDLQHAEKIGQGAFGVVFRAEWRGILVAVKQLLNQSQLTQVQVDDFLGEVKILQGLRPHPNVVLFIGIAVSPDPISLITEFCEGGDLLSWLVTNKEQVTISQQRSFIRDVALGLRHLHSENIVHRDLAARNILLTRDLLAKVSDFGLSREQESTEESKTTSNVGPLKWMAPEAISDQKYSQRSDVYSFGIIVWEITNCCEPYSGITAVNAAMGVVQNGLRPAVTSVPIGSGYVSMMQSCWQQDASQRPTMESITSFLNSGNAEESKLLTSFEASGFNSRPQSDVYAAIPSDYEEHSNFTPAKQIDPYEGLDEEIKYSTVL